MKKLKRIGLLTGVIALVAVSLASLVSCSANDPIRETVYYAGDPPITLVGDGLVYQQKPMPIQIARIIAVGTPTRVELGIFQGFSLPIGGVNEELFTCQCVPENWDGNTMYLYIGGWLDTANTDKNFQLRISYEYWTSGDVVPITSNDVDVEIATGVAAQYTSFKIQFAIAPGDIAVGDALGIKLTRIAASADEIAGEFVVEGMILVYRVDNLGSATP